jgi:hypothetical protein
MDDHRQVVVQAMYRAAVRLLMVDVDYTPFDWCVRGH